MTTATTTQRLLDGVTATVTGAEYTCNSLRAKRAIHGSVVGSGAVGATIQIFGGNIPGQLMLLGTITLSGTNSANDGFVIDAPWVIMQAKLTAISGTDAAVTVALGA